MKLTETPPEPTEAERRKFWYGREGNKRGQYARKDKSTGNVELWWTGGEGHWGAYGCGSTRAFVITKPRLALR